MHRLLDLKYWNKQVKGDWTEVKMLFASTCLPKLNPAEKIYSIVHLFKYNMPSFDKRKSRPLFRIRGQKKVEIWRLCASFDHEQITSKVLPLISALDVLFIWLRE